MLSHIQLFATLWAVAHQILPYMEFSWQEYCSGLPFPTPEDLPNPGIEPMSPALAGGFFTCILYYVQNKQLMRTYCMAQGTLLSTLR